MKLRIEDVQVRKDITRIEAYKRLKENFNLGTMSETNALYNKMLDSYGHEVFEEDILKLQTVFTFKCQTLEERKRQIEEQEYYENKRKKVEAAQKWFNTLSPEHQEHIQYLGIGPATG